ncbi:hypothetical protein [Kribbella turkmenica]|uniref:hypothetical protein n=1 Tax=Kribbella turkmenica TaxID=2530375 RepID=UPI0014044A60|nr:hypothetical protein [Kribbella turkmenica]
MMLNMAAADVGSAVVEDLVVFEYQPTSVQIGRAVLASPLDIRQDGIGVPSGRGLGVEIDAGAIRSLAEEFWCRPLSRDWFRSWPHLFGPTVAWICAPCAD